MTERNEENEYKMDSKANNNPKLYYLYGDEQCRSANMECQAMSPDNHWTIDIINIFMFITAECTSLRIMV
jgi:hypothetical protein